MPALLSLRRGPAIFVGILVLLLLLQSGALAWVLLRPGDWQKPTDVIAEARAATVSILVDAASRGGPQLDGRAAADAPRGLAPGGTGFIIDPQGIIVTNLHTIQGARELAVRLADGRELAAELVGSDTRTDLAVMKVSADGPLPSLAFASSASLGVGERVIALGDPFGYDGSATLGIVSALGRAYGNVDPIGYIQHDAAINPGSSGGPLLNTAGEVVGINSAIADEAPFNIGIGLAIPADRARAVVSALLQDGHVVRGYAGVTLQNLDPNLRDALALPATAAVIVTAVEEGSPAARAGLMAGDVVTGVEGRIVQQLRDLNRALLDSRPGNSLTLDLLRKGRETSVTVTLSSAPLDDAPANHRPHAEVSREPASRDHGRPELEIVFADEVRSRGADAGQAAAVPPTTIRGLERGSFAASLGLAEGDVIRAVGRQAVETSDDIRDILDRQPGPMALLVERPGQGTAYLLVPNAPLGFGNKVPSGNHGSVSAGPF